MTLLTLENIPNIPIEIQENVLDLALRVKANGEPARIFVSKREHLGFSGDDKIVIVWDSPNSDYGESFTTKYFQMETPGILTWGEAGQITIEAIE
jgi:hypothetical protein